MGFDQVIQLTYHNIKFPSFLVLIPFSNLPNFVVAFSGENICFVANDSLIIEDWVFVRLALELFTDWKLPICV